MCACVRVCVGFPLVTSSHAHPLQIVITNSFLFVRPPLQFCQASGRSWKCRLLSFIGASGWRIHFWKEMAVQTERWWCFSVPALTILLPFVLHNSLFAASSELKNTGLSQPAVWPLHVTILNCSVPVSKAHWIFLISKYREKKRSRITAVYFSFWNFLEILQMRVKNKANAMRARTV